MTEQSILFVCNMNSVRSPMAEAVARHILGDGAKVSSCGVYRGAQDPFVGEALNALGMTPVTHEPQEFGQCNLNDFELVVALTPEAAAQARKLHKDVEFWEVENPTDTRGSELDLKNAYARLRDDLSAKIRERFQR